MQHSPILHYMKKKEIYKLSFYKIQCNQLKMHLQEMSIWKLPGGAFWGEGNKNWPKITSGS